MNMMYRYVMCGMFTGLDGEMYEIEIPSPFSYKSKGAPSHWEIPINTNHTYLTFSEDHHKNTVTVRFENYGDPYLDRSVHILCPYSLSVFIV